jgi:hypothetical protein
MLWMNRTEPNQTYVHFSLKKYRKDGVTNLKGIIKIQCHCLSERRKKDVQRCRGEYQLSEQDLTSQHFHSILTYQSAHTIKVTQEIIYSVMDDKHSCFIMNLWEKKLNNGIQAFNNQCRLIFMSQINIHVTAYFVNPNSMKLNKKIHGMQLITHTYIFTLHGFFASNRNLWFFLAKSHTK